MSEEQPKQTYEGLALQGELQIDIAIRALRRHTTESKALNFLTRISETYAKFPEHGGDASFAVYMGDPEMGQELIDALRSGLKRNDLDEYEWVAYEELLNVQEQTPNFET